MHSFYRMNEQPVEVDVEVTYSSSRQQQQNLQRQLKHTTYVMVVVVIIATLLLVGNVISVLYMYDLETELTKPCSDRSRWKGTTNSTIPQRMNESCAFLKYTISRNTLMAMNTSSMGTLTAIIKPTVVNSEKQKTTINIPTPTYFDNNNITI